MKFVIIGGDAAGMSAASRAKRKDPQMDVTVLERTMDVSYSACGMPYNIADPGRNMDDLIVRKAEVFREKNKINLLTGHRVDNIDRDAKRVSGVTFDNQEFSYSYDKLLIATGAVPAIPEIPGANLPGVMALKSLEQGRAIKAYISSNGIKKAVIIGMGYIGLEMCEALRARDIDVTMVKPGPTFLPWMTPTLADVVKKELEDNQVNLLCGCNITKIEPGRDRALTIHCQAANGKGDKEQEISEAGEKKLDAGMVIVASGVIPCSDIAIAAGIETGIQNAISVDRTLKTSDENIYAAGDCADAYHVVTGKKCWIPLALRANRAGWAVADTVCGAETELQGVAGTAVFKVFDLQVARTGLSMKEALDAGFDAVEETVQTRSKAHGHPGAGTIHVSMVGDRKSGRLLGVQMVGKDGVAHRINAPAVALHAKMSVADFIQTDLAYAPPFGPVWDPVLTAANQLVKLI
ncbi:Pyridine nucleotide-disulphide oxidoreductase dimerisation region [Desulfamplus magnetovallimortis]|uniref:Pyridine nucleotide-disulphide oxidoreductase dimerisation region n=1 Tax=Desulfamplus magnetovallimortis TaxID=1246637 RepID=A0A1W1HFP0_9BACT|nr:FAD-dependent oxidoreductase [Desulfamplus magnetovallimortis]SLM31290.1 Pyridine nucleotide-disulphide oxidoreductase dimerisation region [Desulfamplus magnetovallimortis]